MADDRLFSRSLGHGERITKLSDLEFRVWTQYVLSADDFGVMRCSSLTIRNDHAALAARPERAISKALERLIDLTLVTPFEHQGRRYICQLTWQDYQKRTWTSRTMQPKPTDDVLGQCSVLTQHLFTIHKGGVKVPKFVVSLEKIQTPAEVYPDLIRTKSEQSLSTRETLTLTPNTNAHTNTNTGERRDVQWERFKAAYPAARRYASFMSEQAFLAECDRVGFDVILAGLERHKRSDTWKRGMVVSIERFIGEKWWEAEPDIEPTKAESADKVAVELAKIDAARAARGR